MPSSEDTALIQRAKRKKELYSELYIKYFPRVKAYIQNRIPEGNPDTAEDLTQETFARAFGSLGHFQPRGHSYLSYLLRIAHNLLVNRYRKKIKEFPLSALKKEIPSKEDIEGHIDLKLNKKMLHQKLKELPQDVQEIFLLRYHHELPIRNISTRVRRTENAVKILLSRLRKHLGEAFYSIRKPFAGRRVNTYGASSKKGSAKKVGEE